MKDKDAQLMMEAWESANEYPREDAAPKPQVNKESSTAEVLAQLKADIDEFFSSGDANDFGSEGIKEAILDMIDQAERFGVPSEPAHEPVPDHSDLIQPTNY